jgi:hypothetical protein
VQVPEPECRVGIGTSHSELVLASKQASAPGKIRTCAHGLGIRKYAGNDGAGRSPTGGFPQVSVLMAEGGGSNRIRVAPEL